MRMLSSNIFLANATLEAWSEIIAQNFLIPTSFNIRKISVLKNSPVCESFEKFFKEWTYSRPSSVITIKTYNDWPEGDVHSSRPKIININYYNSKISNIHFNTNTNLM